MERRVFGRAAVGGLGLIVVAFVVLLIVRDEDGELPAGPQRHVAEVDIDAIRAGAQDPPRVEISRGDDIRFELVSEDAVDFHLHGLDYEAQAGPNATAADPTVLELTDLRSDGVFEAEAHSGPRDPGDVVATLVIEP